MQDTIELHGNTWQLSDISAEIAWCTEQEWELVPYSKEHDHDHCEICYWSISISSDPAIGLAYHTKGNHWLCQECFNKFADRAPT